MKRLVTASDIATFTTSATQSKNTDRDDVGKPRPRQAIRVSLSSEDLDMGNLPLVRRTVSLSTVTLDAGIDTKQAEPIPLATALGMPTIRALPLSRLPTNADKPTSTHILSNVHIEGLTDHLTLLEGINAEDVLLFTEDDVDLQLEEVQVIMEYDRQHLHSVRRGSDSGKMSSIMGFTCTPEGFVKVFEWYKAEQVKEGKEEWRYVVCPQCPV